MRKFVSTSRAYLKFAMGLRSYLQQTVTDDELKSTIQNQLKDRNRNFLYMLKTNIFHNPRSPYLRLFKRAGLTYQDVKNLTTSLGLENTLKKLYDKGVYMTFDEFKCRIPIERRGLKFHVATDDFDMLDLDPIMIGRTGGTTGTATLMKMDFNILKHDAKHYHINNQVHGVKNATVVQWWGLFPDTTAAHTILAYAYIGFRNHYWFSTAQSYISNASWTYIFLTYIMILMSRFHGLKFPFPRYVAPDDPFPIVELIEAELKNGRSVVLESTASRCARVSLCAQKHDIDLTGVIVYGLSEPSTKTKVSIIEASGIKFLNWYEAAETTIIGMPCKNPSDHTDVHLLSHDLALITHPQDVFDQTVNTFYFTSLLPSNPKMLLNVQLDDFGIVEKRDCGCLYHQLGFNIHIRQMSSFRKLTGEGVTLVGSDMIHILEHVLPLQFGGSLLDYQLVEEETKRGLTKLLLYVNPSVDIEDENALLEAFLEAMKNSMPSTRLAQTEYRASNVVEVRREKPFVTNRGKHFPIRTLNIKS